MTNAVKTLPRLPYPWEDLIEADEWRREDKKEWERLETLRLAGSTVTTKESQDVHVHELHLYSHPCWLCGQSNMYYFAQGKVLVEYDKREFHCVRCKVQLSHAVPLMAIRPWYWARPADIKPSTVIHHAELWQEALMHEGKQS